MTELGRLAAGSPVLESRHWALFADWCTATEAHSLPATPATVLAFLDELPASDATVRRRLLAIDAAHRYTGYPPPSAGPQFDTVLRPLRPARFDPPLVAAALAAIPVGGWPAGIVGRRDAALVALVCSVGLTRRQLQALRIPAPVPGDGRWTGQVGESLLPAIASADNPGACPACAFTRWQWVASAIASTGWRVVRNHLADLGDDTAGHQTSHDCTRPVAGHDPTDDAPWTSNPPSHPLDRHLDDDRPVPLFCAIDRHGTPQTGYALSTRSVTTIVAGRLAAAQADRRGPVTVAVERARVPAAAWSSDDHARVVAARQVATDRLASFEADLDEADAYAEAILRRLESDLADGSA